MNPMPILLSLLIGWLMGMVMERFFPILDSSARRRPPAKETPAAIDQGLFIPTIQRWVDSGARRVTFTNFAKWDKLNPIGCLLSIDLPDGLHISTDFIYRPDLQSAFDAAVEEIEKTIGTDWRRISK